MLLQRRSESLRVLVLVPGTLGERVSGPEIRGWRLARELARTHEVTILAPNQAPERRHGVQLLPYSRLRLAREALRHDVVIGALLPPFVLALRPWLGLTAVSDQYDPVELELSTLGSGRLAKRRCATARAARRLQLRFSDLVLCAGERQRARLVPELEALMDGGSLLSVPFGVDHEPPVAVERSLPDWIPQIADGDTVVLWWGSLWRWLDAETAIAAVTSLAADRPAVKLVLTSGRAPQTSTDRFATTEQARAFARELGVLDSTVFFLDEWVPWERRGELLRTADVGLTLHRDTPEAPLAARARYMDYLWAPLPCVLTRGDDMADSFAKGGFATLVEPGDADGVARALANLLEPEALAAARRAAEPILAAHSWERVMAPVTDAIAEARRPGDRRRGAVAGAAASYYLRRVVDRLATTG
jgi:glycosyltransferase involved in cell wall biosynthesis